MDLKQMRMCPECKTGTLRNVGIVNGKRRYRCRECLKYCSFAKDYFEKVDSKSESKPAKTPAPEPVLQPREIIDLERRVSGLQRDLTVAKVKQTYLEKELDDSNKKIELLSALKKNVYSKDFKFEPKFKNKNEATAVICLSDLHLEEDVDPRMVNGLNEYNPIIAEKRFKNLIANSLKLVNMHAAEIPMTQVVLWLGGDVISGYIHDELVESNHMSPVEAILFADRLLAWAIDFYLNNSKYDLLVPTSNGNHGRTTHKIRISTYAANSFEYILYKNLENRYQSEPRVKFKVSESYHNYVQFYDKFTVRFHHGDQVKYHGGSGGIYIPVNKAIAAWDSGELKADLDVIGHFHQLTCDRKFVCNGSLIGLNPFGISIKASPEPPSQAFFLIDKERNRRTAFYPIFVDGNISVK